MWNLLSSTTIRPLVEPNIHDGRGLGVGSNLASKQSAVIQLCGASMQLGWLARVLPAAADGSYGPLRTPTNELEQRQMLAGQLLLPMVQDPILRPRLQKQSPLSDCRRRSSISSPGGRRRDWQTRSRRD